MPGLAPGFLKAHMQELLVIGQLIEGKLPLDWAGSPLEAAYTARYAGLAQPLDEWAADHYQVFGMEVFPFASVFLTAEAQMGGAPLEWAAEFYRRSGWYPKTQPDQACAMVRFLDQEIPKDREAAGEFLSAQVLTWLPVFGLALMQLQHPFFSPLGKRLNEVLATCVRELQPSPFEIPLQHLTPEFLADPEQGLKEIAHRMLAPALCGVYFSRVDQLQIAHALELPVSFATRSQIMPSLWYASVDYHKQGELVQALSHFVEGWIQGLQALPAPLAPWLTPWVVASQGTLASLPLIKPIS